MARDLCKRLTFALDATEYDGDRAHFLATAKDGAVLQGAITGDVVIDEDSGGLFFNVGTVRVEDAARRCGIATRLYELLAEEGCKRRMPMRSDTYRSKASEAFWKKQVTKGRARCVEKPRGKGAIKLNDAMQPIYDVHGLPLRWACLRYQMDDPCPTSLAALDGVLDRAPDWLPAALLAAGGALLLLSGRRSAQTGLRVVFGNPVPGTVVGSGWGRERKYRNGTHYGIDLFAPTGTPVLAAAAGRVITAQHADTSTAGKHAIIETHTPLGKVSVRYLHLDEVQVLVGEEVKLGQQVGTVGSTGTSNSGPHLHLDVFASPGVLAEYQRTFGWPKPGFPPARKWGTQVPAEALIPVDGYNKRTIAEAGARNVTLRSV